MRVCVFIAANCPLPEIKPSRHDPLYINPDNNTVYDDGADDSFPLLPFHSVYCEKIWGIFELPLYTDGREKQILAYIKTMFRQTESVELWNVWLLGYWEYDDRPYIHRKTVPIDDLTIADIKKINHTEN